MPGDSERRFRGRELLSGFNNQRIAALSEPDHQHLVARIGLFEGVDQHQQGVCRTCLAAGVLQVITHARVGYPECLGECGGDPAGGRREAEMGDRTRVDRSSVQCPSHRRGDDLEIPLVTDPASSQT